ncbi:hypothetical protein [Urechidicola croceus]|uniref:Uncharacterized protein n=1 Tax=Urechidicola croceus TaxID=1850246 RepID=A0A1D8P4H6_9FLAO|nr:hypothetical protein [Urechidicola croceus]AOW19457.1 hypothetical protein LPB138_01595 [Urechidicola croceus]
MNLSKNKKLVISIVLDALGYVSIIFPPFDFVWAPLSAYIMTKLYKGKKGKIAAVVSFVEEALPFLDVIPTFTLMWLYTYVIDKKKVKTVVDV